MFTDQGAEAAGKNQVAKVLIDRKHLVLVIDHFTGHSSKEPKSRLDINCKSDPSLAEVALGVFTIARLRLFLIGPALRSTSLERSWVKRTRLTKLKAVLEVRTPSDGEDLNSGLSASCLGHLKIIL